jgi:hypothetical protein
VDKIERGGEETSLGVHDRLKLGGWYFAAVYPIRSNVLFVLSGAKKIGQMMVP